MSRFDKYDKLSNMKLYRRYDKVAQKNNHWH